MNLEKMAARSSSSSDRASNSANEKLVALDGTSEVTRVGVHTRNREAESSSFMGQFTISPEEKGEAIISEASDFGEISGRISSKLQEKSSMDLGSMAFYSSTNEKLTALDEKGGGISGLSKKFKAKYSAMAGKKRSFMEGDIEAPSLNKRSSIKKRKQEASTEEQGHQRFPPNSTLSDNVPPPPPNSTLSDNVPPPLPPQPFFRFGDGDQLRPRPPSSQLFPHDDLLAIRSLQLDDQLGREEKL